MWSRCCEMLLGGWLIASPFLFGHPGERWSWWLTDVGCGLLAVAFASLSFRGGGQPWHLLNFLVAAWLCGFGYFGAPYPTPSALQNQLFVGLVLAMFAIVPNHAFRPPAEWEAVWSEGGLRE